MSLKRLSLLTIVASLACPLTQWLALTSVGGLQGLWSVATIVTLIVWIALLMLTVARYGARAWPLLLTFLPPLGLLALTVYALIQCGITDICF